MPASFAFRSKKQFCCWKTLFIHQKVPLGQVCKALVTQLVTSRQLTYVHSYRKLNRILPSPDNSGRIRFRNQSADRHPSYPALQGIYHFWNPAVAGQRSAPPQPLEEGAAIASLSQRRHAGDAWLIFRLDGAKRLDAGDSTVSPPGAAAAATEGFDGTRARVNGRSKIERQVNRSGANYR